MDNKDSIYTTNNATMQEVDINRSIQPDSNIKLFFQKIYYFVFVIVIVFTLIINYIWYTKSQAPKKQDALIEKNLESVNGDIKVYIYNNKKLPESLNDVTFKSNAKKITDKNLVTYKKSISESVKEVIKDSKYTFVQDTIIKYNYELCVFYNNKNTTDSTTTQSDNFISTISHPKGEVCYKQTYSINE